MWSGSGVNRILSNPLYIGLIPYHKQMFPGEHEALITQETWDAVHALLHQNNGIRKKHLRHRKSAMLSSLLRCGECNSSMTTIYTDKHRTRYYYYCCQHSLKYPDMKCSNHELPVREAEKVVLFQLEILFRCYSMRQMICEESEALRKTLLRDMSKERSGLRSYIQNCRDPLSCRDAQKKIDSLSMRMECIQSEIKTRSILKEMDLFQDLWNELTAEKKLDLLDSIIEKVDIFPDRVWTYLKPDFSGLEPELSAQLRIAGVLTHIKRDGENLIFATPTNIKTCSGQTHIEIIGENYENNRRCILRMIALSWKWTAMLFSGEVSSVSQLARRVGFSASYVTKIISLFNLAPSIVEDIVNGRIPDGLSIKQMTDPPDDWQEQCKKFGFSFRRTGF